MDRTQSALLAVLLSWLMMSAPVRAQEPFIFGVVNNTVAHVEHESLLIQSLTDTAVAGLPLVVVNGIKSASESCSDNLYQQRYDLFNLAETAIILSLSQADWIACTNAQGASIATHRLTHICDLFFSDATSLGQYMIPVLRQSILPQFRRYAENARWESHGVLFSTINLPAPNNHWVNDGGRNAEFEDRLIANKNWLHRLFSLASANKVPGIVIFTDAHFLTLPSQSQSLLHEQRDGFIEMRQTFYKLAAGYAGRILLVSGQSDAPASPAITWAGNIGHIASQSPWMAIRVDHRTPALFTLDKTVTVAPAITMPDDLSAASP